MKRLWENTGKKVLIVAHSFGNLQTAHNLWNMSQADKDKYIARYIALAPPYLGSSQLVSGLIGFDARYTVSLGFTDVGVTVPMFKDVVADSRGIFNLMNKKAVAVNRNTKWWQAILGRIDAENNNRAQAAGTIMDIFPPATASCTPYFKQRDAKCKFSFFDID